MDYDFNSNNKNQLNSDTYRKTSSSMENVVKSSPTYTEIMRSFAVGDLKVKLKKRFMLKKIDELWINAIEDALPSLDAIIRNPQFRLQEKEEVLPVEISKHINGRSVVHLSQHTDLINEIKDDGTVVPSQLLNVFQEDTFLTYENKFINTLINRLYAFIAVRYNGAKECGEDEKNTMITMDQNFEHNDYKGKISLSIEIGQEPKEHEIIKNYIYTSDLWKRVQKIYQIVGQYTSSSFVQNMGRNFVRPPIMRTNTLLKNPLFKDCLALWEFIDSYENTGYETLVQEDLLNVPNKLLEDMYNTIAEQYVVFQSHLDNTIEEEKALDSRIVNISPKIQEELEELDEDEFNYKTLIPDILTDEMPLPHPDDEIEYAILVALAADSMLYEESEEEDATVINKSGEILYRYKYSFYGRLIKAQLPTQDFYDDIKNELMSYNDIKCYSSWSRELFKCGRKQCAKLNCKGKTLYVYLPLDPKEFDVNKYHHLDVSKEDSSNEYPFLIKVRSNRACKYAKELIAIVMERYEIAKREAYEYKDYHLPEMSIEEMLEKNYARLVNENGSFHNIETYEEEVENTSVSEEVSEQQPTEEVAPIETPVEQNEVLTNQNGIEYLYKFSYTARLILSGEERQDFYNTLKNNILSYKKVTSKISWGHELFKLGRNKLAMFKVRGKTLCVYLPLDPDKYDKDRLFFQDLREEGKEVEFPMLMKVKSNRAVKYVCELIADVMNNNGIILDNDYVEQDYKFKDMSIEEMLVSDPVLAKRIDGNIPEIIPAKTEEVQVETQTNEENIVAEEVANNEEVVTTNEETPVQVGETQVIENQNQLSFECKYKLSYLGRLILAGEDSQGFYNELKNHVLSYKKVISKISWGHELFKLGRNKLAMFKVRGKTLCVYLPLDPDKYDKDRLFFQDLREEGKEVEFPMLMKVKSNRAVKYTCELIDEVMKIYGILVDDKYVAEDFKFAPMSIDEMLVSNPPLAKYSSGFGQTNVFSQSENQEVSVLASNEPKIEEVTTNEEILEKAMINEESVVSEEVTNNEEVVTTNEETPVQVSETQVIENQNQLSFECRYKLSYLGRLILAGEDSQGFYNELKNHVLSYKKVISKTSWGHELFKLGRNKLAMFKVRGKTICVYLPLDPGKYDKDKYFFQDLREEGKEVEFPMLMKVKSNRAVKYTCELIDEVMKIYGILVDDKYVAEDFKFAPMSIDEMLVSNPPLAKYSSGFGQTNVFSQSENQEVGVLASNGPKIEEVVANEEILEKDEEKVEEVVVTEAPIEETSQIKVDEVKVNEEIQLTNEENVANSETTINNSTSDTAELGFDGKYKLSHTAHIILSGKETQDFYNELKNEFLSYNKVNSKISWSHELFKYGKNKLGLLKVKGKTVCVYLPLDPDKYEYKKYFFKDMRANGKEVEFPMMMKVKSNRGVRYVRELVNDVMANNGLTKIDNYISMDYRLKEMTIEEMLMVGPSLIKIKGAPTNVNQNNSEESLSEETVTNNNEDKNIPETKTENFASKFFKRIFGRRK